MKRKILIIIGVILLLTMSFINYYSFKDIIQIPIEVLLFNEQQQLDLSKLTLYQRVSFYITFSVFGIGFLYGFWIMIKRLFIFLLVIIKFFEISILLIRKKTEKG